MNYEQEYKEFSKWWEELTAENPNWATLERLAAKDAWMEATKRAEVNGAEKSVSTGNLQNVNDTVCDNYDPEIGFPTGNGKCKNCGKYHED